MEVIYLLKLIKNGARFCVVCQPEKLFGRPESLDTGRGLGVESGQAETRFLRGTHVTEECSHWKGGRSSWWCQVSLENLNLWNCLQGAWHWFLVYVEGQDTKYVRLKTCICLWAFFWSQFSAPADVCLGCNWNWCNAQNPRTLTGADRAGWWAGSSLAFKIWRGCFTEQTQCMSRW